MAENAESREEKFMSVVITPQGGKPIAVHSTDKPHTEAEFGRAYEAGMAKSGIAPEGYVFLTPGSVPDYLRTGFHAAKQPVQKFIKEQAADYGEYSAPQVLPMILEKLGVIQPGTAQAYKAQGRAEGQETGETLAGMIDTPGKAAAAGAGLVATTLGGPVTKMAQIPARMAATGTAAGLASAGARALTGEGFPATQVGVDAGLAALGEGAKGVVNYFIGKFLPTSEGKKVYDEMVGALKAKYPNFANDPDLINMATKASSEQIRQMTQIGTRALTGSTDKLADDVTLGIKQGFNAYGPRGMSQGEQVSLRSKAKALASAGRDLLENIDDSAKADAAREAMRTAADGIDEFTRELVKKSGMKGDPKGIYLEAYKAVQSTLDTIKHAEQGAKVLSAFRQAGAEGGFDPVKFNNVIAKKYMSEPGSLMEQIGGILGRGRPLQPPGQPRTVAQNEPGAVNWLRNFLFGSSVNKPIDWLTQRVPATPASPLAWQTPKQLPGLIANTIQQGPAAISGFIHREED